AEQRHGADCLQRPLRSRFRQRLMPGVRLSDIGGKVMSVKQFPRQDGDSTADEYKGKVDFAIITIRPYEYRTVLKRFPTQIIARGKWDYSIAQLQSCDSHCYTVAVVRCLRQGTNHAQSVTRDLIDDLNPKWILTVGIAGGVPDSDFTLGDVIVSTYV